MQQKLNYLKNFFKILIWPLLFEIGQFFVILIFTFIFNNQYIKTLEQQYSNLSNKELQIKLLESTTTADYQEALAVFLNNNMLIMILISFAILTPIFIIVFKKINSDKKITISIKKIIVISIISITLALSLNLIIYYLNTIINFTDRYEESKLMWPLFISVGIIGPIIEEIVFRGIIYNKLKTFNSTKTAMIITTTIFAVIHFEPSQFIYAFIIGLFLVILYEKHQNIKIPVLAHTLINISTLILVSFII